MTRLIDGDALIELINGGYDLDFEEVPETKRELLRMIMEQPTVDAVQVIRCKDCKHKYIENKVWQCPFGLSGGPDLWCGYGAERKEE